MNGPGQPAAGVLSPSPGGEGWDEGGTSAISYPAIGYARSRAYSVPVEKLTPRQREIVRLQSQGLLQKQIADRLHISLGTVKTHILRAHKRTGARSRCDLCSGGHGREITAIARKIQLLLAASSSAVKRQSAWPPFR